LWAAIAKESAWVLFQADNSIVLGKRGSLRSLWLSIAMHPKGKHPTRICGYALWGFAACILESFKTARGTAVEKGGNIKDFQRFRTEAVI